MNHPTEKESFSDSQFDGAINNFSKNNAIPSINIIMCDMKIPPTVTIAIPTFRRPELLKEAIRSAVDQQHYTETYEIMVVDNDPIGINNPNEEIVRSFKSCNIVYYRNTQNLGMFGNWNRCFELARGEWVALLHDDDLLSPFYLNQIVPMLEKKSGIGAICAKEARDYEEYKEGLGLYKSGERHRLQRVFPIETVLCNFDHYGVPSCGVIFRRNAVLRSGGFCQDLFPSADWFFMYSFNLKNKIYKTDFITGYYRMEVNESLNLDTVIRFISDAEKLRRFFRDSLLSGRIVYTLFHTEQHYRYLASHRKILAKNGYSLSDLNYIEYYRNRRFIRKLYLLLMACYRRFNKIGAFLFG